MGGKQSSDTTSKIKSAFSKLFSKDTSNDEKRTAAKSVVTDLVDVDYQTFMDKDYDQKAEMESFGYFHNHHDILQNKGHFSNPSINSIDSLNSVYKTLTDPKADQNAKKKAFRTRTQTLQTMLEDKSISWGDFMTDKDFEEMIEPKAKVWHIPYKKKLPPDPKKNKKNKKPLLEEEEKAPPKARYDVFGDDYNNNYNDASLFDYGVPGHYNMKHIENGQNGHVMSHYDYGYYRNNNNSDGMYMYLSISLIINVILLAVLISLICCIVISIGGYIMIKINKKKKNYTPIPLNNESIV